MQIPKEAHERLALLLSTPGRRLLGITGPPGAGKSTLASALTDQFGDQAALVPMDGFHLSNFQLARLGRSERKGAPDTFDAAGYVSLLRRLRSPEPDEIIYAPEFQRQMEESIAAAIAIPPAISLVITEGNYLLLDSGGWGPVRALLNEVWFVDLPGDERRSRLVRRHKEFGRSQEAAQQWVDGTDEPNARLIEGTRNRAHFQLSF